MIAVRVWIVTLAVLATTLGAVGSVAPAAADEHVWVDPTNHALTGTAAQSSTADGGWTADKANDGNVGAWNGPPGIPLVTRTKFDVNAWWEIDLGSVKSIPEVKVWRTEFVPILENFSVFVSDVPFLSTDFATTQQQAIDDPSVYEYSFGASPDCAHFPGEWFCDADPFEEITHNGTGRYVRVQTHNQAQLTLAEVEIGGPFDELDPEPVPAWGVRGLGPSLSTIEAQEVWAIEQIGGTLYVGGRFLEVINQRFGGPAQEVHDQSYIAAFDASTGEFIDFWRPELDGAVFALEASPDGSKLFVGGEFTNVDGIPHTAGLAALDPQTGNLIPTWRASLEKRFVVGAATVRNLEIAGGHLYVVGNFSNAITFPNLTNRSVKNAIRVSLTDGEIDNGWKPAVTGGAVWGVGVDLGRGRVYLAGKFQSVNGTPGSEWFHTVSTAPGAASVPGLQPLTFIHSQRDQRDVVVAGDRVWVGGAQHYLQMLDASDLSLVRGYFTGRGAPPGGLSGGGDIQDIELVGDRIYATCHCWLTSGDGSKLWEYSPDGVGGLEGTPLDFAYGNFAFDAQTGDYFSQFGSEPDDYRGILGGWAVHGAPDGCVWFGGDFDSKGEQWPIGLMRQCPQSVGSNPPPITPGPSDSTSPSTPTGVTAVQISNDRVNITWNPSTDNEAVAGYLVYRDGEQILGSAGTVLRYTEIPNVEHTWTVRAIDPSGNLSPHSTPSNALTISKPGYPTTYVDENFAADDGGFVYSDDVFLGTSQPDYALGWFDVTGGPQDGAVAVHVGGIDDDDINNISGGWAKTFDLAGPTDAELSLTIRTEAAWVYESNEYVESLVSIDGSLVGVAADPNDPSHLYMERIYGSCDLNGGSCTDSWATYVIDLGTLGAGSHTIEIGAFNNQKTEDRESGSAAFDNVRIGSPFPGVGFTNPVEGGEVSGLFTVGVGADDLVDVAGSLDVEVLLPGESWGDPNDKTATWDPALGVYTRQWNTMAHPDGPATLEARATDSDGNTAATSTLNVVVNNDEAPTAIIATPLEGAIVSGTKTVRVNANDDVDPPGSLDVEVDVGDGLGYQPTTWNPVNDRYEFSWDTTLMADGPAVVRARATDSDDNETNAAARNVTIDNIDEAPVATISAPTEGLTVSGTFVVKVNATDAEDVSGSLDVDVNVGNGWQPAAWNAGTQRYEYSWNTTTDPDGPAVVQARATDSAANTTNATSRNVTIQNTVDSPPTVQLVTPASNTVISGDYSIRVEAHDAEDADETLTVEVNYGTGWQPATWNTWTKLFHAKILTIDEGLPDGPFVMKARVTDSANQTSQTADVPMNISNSAYAQSVFDDKPVMYWRFNETDGDMAGDSRKANDNGVYNGVNPNSTTLLSDGAPGTAARFDGADDWVWLPNRKALNTGGPYERRTIELWFRADDTNGRQVLWQEGGAGRGFNIYLAGDRLYAGAWNQVNDDPTTPWPPSFVSYDGIVAGETYYVALTFTSVGDKVRLFVNGELVDSDGGVGNLFAHVARSSIGGVDQGTRFHDGKSNWSGYYFDGKIDEVAVFNRTLSLADFVERWEIGSGIG